MKLVVPLGTRCSQATKLVPQGTLVRRMLYGIRAGNSLVGCAELLLVRKPPIPQASLCRICLDDGEEGSFDDDDTLNQTVLTALTGGGEDGGSRRVARGNLLRDACSCRGSAAAVHEGCLASWLVASGKWGDHVCGECRQPYVGRAALVLARLHQRLRAVEAAASAATAAHTLETGTPSEGAQAALDADTRAVTSLEATHNEAVNVWRASRFTEAANMFAALQVILMPQWLLGDTVSND